MNEDNISLTVLLQDIAQSIKAKIGNTKDMNAQGFSDAIFEIASENITQSMLDRTGDGINRIENITFTGENLTSINNSAIANIKKLKNITLGEGITTIGDSVFSGCTELTAVDIPKNVTSIGMKLFIGCDKLLSVSVNGDNEIYDSRSNCNAIIKKSSDTLIVGCVSTVIPDTVRMLGEYAFQYVNIKSVEIPVSVTSIGNHCFSNCTALTKVLFAEGSQLTTLGQNSFVSCNKLNSITLPENVVEIPSYCFYNCSALTTFKLPGKISKIRANAFALCSKLTVIDCTSCESIPVLESTNAIPSSVQYIVVPNMTSTNWEKTTNWSTFSAKIKEKDEYEDDLNNT